MAERCQDLGSGAKTSDISGQREAKTWVFLGSADPKSWVSLSRVKVDIMRIRSFYLMRATFFNKFGAQIYVFCQKNHLQVKFVNFTPRLGASLGRENPSLGFLCQVLESVSSLHVH